MDVDKYLFVCSLALGYLETLLVGNVLKPSLSVLNQNILRC